MHKQSFAAIISEQPKTLILGSLPGDLSLEVNQYYGHPRNRFWKMMFEIFETEFSEDYEIRKQLILQNKLALWDVAHSAERKGHYLKYSIMGLVKHILGPMILE